MADPIARWRNPYFETVRELISYLPKNISTKAEARKSINERYGGDFFHTPYQLACQLGLYYESEDTFYPRFLHDPSVDEIHSYLNQWIKLYQVPNPYTKRGFTSIEPFCVHSKLCEKLIKSKKEINWKLVSKEIFKEEIGNSDILVNSINRYSMVINIKDDTVCLKPGINFEDLNQYVGIEGIQDRNDKKEFFEIFENVNKEKTRKTNILKLKVNKTNSFNIKDFQNSLNKAGLKYPDLIVTRMISSLLSKKFLILTGLSGSGKTKLAQSFVQWLCQDKSQYTVVPVGADWTNREPLLGFPNALNQNEYVQPDSGVLALLQNAKENDQLPYFLILDEMNLSHVERYFADFLSVMESNESIHLHSMIDCNVPNKIDLPENLFIIGTVNIDETTYMFSPKVLDRANTIEFRIDENELAEFLKDNQPIIMSEVGSKGSGMASSFVNIAQEKNPDSTESINKRLISFFSELKKAGAEFGYRTANEIHILLSQLGKIESSLTEDEKLDIAVMQKLLPKLHGSRRKLEKVLFALSKLCLSDGVEDSKVNQFLTSELPASGEEVLFPISLEKIQRMYQGAIDHGFASYAEA